MLHRLFALLFPPKCILCGQLLEHEETDLCHNCRTETEEFTRKNFKIPFLAGWTAVWYYNDKVRESLLRYKFYGRRSYAAVYGRLLAMKLQSSGMDDFDILTWVPISRRRRRKRGFDQVELLAKAVAKELGTVAVPTLKKVRHTPPQSTQPNAAGRRANILGAYEIINRENIRDKRVLLLDDIVTTGATLSECAKMLSIAHAGKVFGAVIAAAPQNKTESH